MTRGKRFTLADRDQAAIIEGTPATHGVRDMPDTRSTHGIQATRGTTGAQQAPATASTHETQERIGIYFSPQEIDTARAAYLADWQDGGEHDTFAGWVAAALTSYADLGADQRANHTREIPRGSRKIGGPRSISVGSSASEAMRRAQREDEAQGRWLSISAWAGDAVALAASKARDRRGGALPVPPKRLPYRLMR